MITYNDLSKFYEVVVDIINQPTTSLAQYKFSQKYHKYSFLFDFFISLSLETENFVIKTIKNSYDIFNFENDLGNILYHYINNDKKQLQLYINKLPFNIQKLLYIIFGNFLIKKITELYALETMSNYYKLSELLTFVKLPDIVNTSDVPVQNLINKELRKITFPLYLFKIPAGYKFNKLVYVSYSNGNFISNIKQGSIREDIKTNIKLPTYSMLGILAKNKKFKRKYKLYIFYFSIDSSNAVNFLKNKGIYDNKLKEFKSMFIPTNIDILTPKVFNLENDFLHYLKYRRNRENVIIQTNSGVDLIKINIYYKNVPILDYIYNDDFEAIGLKVEYKNNIYDIYFNVMNTTYVESIKDRFVRVGIITYKDKLINIVYNSEVEIWHPLYDKCLICKTTEYKYAMKGLCNSCLNKLNKITTNISGNINFKCDTIFSLVLNGCQINSDGNFLYIKPLKGKQLSLPFEDIISVCKE